MSLDVCVQLSPSRHKLVSVCAFEKEGYYWFLLPLFEQLHRETEQMIDLYDDATFGGQDLVALERMIDAACVLTAAQPEM